MHLTQSWTLNGQGTNGTRRTMQCTFPYLTLATYVNKHIKNTLHLHCTIKAELHNTTSCLRFPSSACSSTCVSDKTNILMSSATTIKKYLRIGKDRTSLQISILGVYCTVCIKKGYTRALKCSSALNISFTEMTFPQRSSLLAFELHPFF